MTKEFHISEGVKVWYEVNIGKWIEDYRKVCPDCVDHKQEKAQENENVADCKNLFWDTVDGKKEIVGQCCCYSKIHGESGGWK